MTIRYPMTLGGAIFLGAAILAIPMNGSAASTTAEKAEDKMERAADKVDRAAEKAERKTEQMTEKTKKAVKDSWVTAKTKIALFADNRVKGTQVNVETKKGIVTLSGKVDTADAKAGAEDIAKGIDGAKGIKNNLQVVPPSKREAVDEKDEAVTDRVKERLKKDPKLKKADISVRTDAGVVTLKGEVQDILTSAQASWAAWTVPGVKSVRNELTYKDEVS